MGKFGDLLAELRKDKAMTQRELANFLHVSVGTISNYEKGVHLPDIDKLIELSDYFDITTDYLLGRCENNLSPDSLNEPITETKTVGDFIQELQQLPPDRRNALAMILSDMNFRMAIQGYSEKEHQ